MSARARCDAAALSALVMHAARTGGSPAVEVSHRFVATGQVLSADERGTRATGVDEYHVYWSTTSTGPATLWRGSWGPDAEEAAEEARAAVLAVLPTLPEGETVLLPWRVDGDTAIGYTVVRVVTRTEQYLEMRYRFRTTTEWSAAGSMLTGDFCHRVTSADIVPSRTKPGMIALVVNRRPTAWLSADEAALLGHGVQS